jgi:hypothetical protein
MWPPFPPCKPKEPTDERDSILCSGEQPNRRAARRRVRFGARRRRRFGASSPRHQGGDTDAGIAVHNFIKASGIQVVAVDMGVVASIGTIIFCAADQRLPMPRARFTFHPHTFSIRDETLGFRQLEEKLNQLKIEHESVAAIVSAATGRTPDEARRLIMEHRSLSAGEAKSSAWCGRSVISASPRKRN